MPEVADVALVRERSRVVVRELGFMNPTCGPTGLTHSQCHAMIELDRDGPLVVAELAERLRLDKSSASRIVTQLTRRGWARSLPSGADRRRKPVTITARGRAQLGRVHDYANDQVSRALSLLPDADREAVVRGMDVYATALGQVRLQRELSIRPMRPSDDPAVARIIRQVMTEFGAVGEGYSILDPEVSRMSAAYADDRSAYWVIARGKTVLGGGGFGPLAGAPVDTCELRKMYFLPELRGRGMGRRLLELCLAEARERGYRTCYLETLGRMATARAMYESAGFRPVAKPMGHTGHFGCDAWYVRSLD